MKYIEADQLIAEIQRLHKAHSGKYGCDEVGLNLEYLEDFITSLQQEQPVEGLEEAAVQAHIQMEECGEEMTFLNTFKAGAKWMAEQAEKEDKI